MALKLICLYVLLEQIQKLFRRSASLDGNCLMSESTEWVHMTHNISKCRYVLPYVIMISPLAVCHLHTLYQSPCLFDFCDTLLMLIVMISLSIGAQH